MSEEDAPAGETELGMAPIVDIPGGRGDNQRRVQSPAVTPENTDDEGDLEGSEVSSNHSNPISARERRRRRTHAKGKNGRSGIDMTPPDKLLREAGRRARKYAQQKKVDHSIHEYIRCTALAQIVHGPNHWRVAKSYADLGEAYFTQKGYTAQTQYHCERGRDIMLSGVHTSSSDQEKADIYATLTKIYLTLGKALTQMKKYKEAEQSLKKADKVIGERGQLSCVSDEECDQVEIELSLAQARLFSAQKKIALAQSRYGEGLEQIQRSLGDDHIDLIPVYQEMGKLEQMKGRHANHDHAIEMFLQAHSVAAANYKEGSLELQDTALAVAKAYASTGKEEAEASAESYLIECLAVCTTGFGPGHPKTLQVQDELARLYGRTDRQEEALSILRSTLPHKCEAFGDYSEQVSDTHKLMASIHLSQGNIERALRFYKKCHNVESLVLGTNHRKTKDTQRTMDILMASPNISHKFVLSKQDELDKRPRFNAVVNRSSPVVGTKS
ncbi:LOW QUALITY PROTEIN: tetratricopeptide repeat protein 23-like [Liolophura sinensis]|uniref:LOW QUALITY PROTEIN: tetratricopeptide repeat protein 23-like n=1 Tax=Liolophura sinensis TaxID=3198878 RepID=UPI0031588284